MENHQMTTQTATNTNVAAYLDTTMTTTPAVMTSSITSQANSNMSKQTALAKNTDGRKPLEMNTYIQLEMDSNNFNCVPRVCKFCVKNLHLQTDLVSSSSSSSVILAVKLEVSKRSLRTVEIPLVKSCNSLSSSSSSSTKTNNSSADLNLNYNITYPHFLKKDSNILYFYIQRRKKYKTRTILGYKTLAYAYIDLATVMQRPFSRDLPLYLKTNSAHTSKIIMANELSSLSQANLKSNTNNRTLVGTLNIFMLVSQPYELVDSLENTNNFNYFRNTIDSLKSEIDDVFDDYDEFNEYLLESKMNTTDTNNLKSNGEIGGGGGGGGGGGTGGARMSIGNGEAMSQSRETDSNHPRKSSNATQSACVFFPSDSDNETEMDNLKKHDENLSELLKIRNFLKRRGSIYPYLSSTCLIS